MGEDLNKSFDIGAVLRRARAERGLSLEEVEEATKIRVRYLEGLEREDYDVLPAAVYVRGFLKSYANFLGLDGEELIRELQRQRTGGEGYRAPPMPMNLGEPEDDLLDPPEGFDSPSEGSGAFSGRTLGLAVVALVFLVGILYFIGKGSQPSAESPNPPPSNSEQAALEKGGEQGGSQGDSRPAPDESPSSPPASDESSATQASSGESSSSESTSSESTSSESSSGTQPSAGETSAGSSAPEEPETLRAKVSVAGGISWLQIDVDGVTRFAQVAGSGFSRTFEAEEEISINTGNAGVVQVEINGQSLGAMGESGEVITETYTLKAAATLTG